MSLADNIYPFKPKPAFNKLRCPKCSAESEAACDCGVDYVQAKELAAQAIALNPELSHREIAKHLSIDRRTVDRAADHVGQKAPREHPREIAAKAIAENPRMTNTEIGEKYHICRSTVGKVRKLLEAGKEIIPPKETATGRRPMKPNEVPHSRQLEEFRRRIGVLAASCTSARDLEIPTLSLEDIQDAVGEIKIANASVRALLIRLNETLAKHKEGIQS